MRLLIDTAILIDHLRGRDDATAYLAIVLVPENEVFCSVVTHAELWGGARSGEEAAITALLSTMSVVDITPDLAQTGGAYRRRFGPSHGVGLADALIAATARSLSAPIITLNAKHFPMQDIMVEVPY